MRAAIWTGAGRPLEIAHVELSPPQSGEVEVEIAACAICHSDLTFMDGGWQHDAPAVFGHEASGRVLRSGAGAQSYNPGDRVAVTLARACGACPDCAGGAPTNCTGSLPIDRRSLLWRDGRAVVQGLRTAAFAERVVVHESQLAPIPDGLPWTSAAVMSCAALTGVDAVTRTARLRPDQTAAVIGVGGVGLNAVQGARISGASQVIAIDPSEERRSAARHFGASSGVDPSSGSVVTQVRDLTQGRGVDFAFVCVGSARVIDETIPMLARGGAIVIVGMPPDGAVGSYDPSALAAANQSILGSKFGRAVISEDIAMLSELYLSGALKLDELVTGQFGFSRIDDAIDATRRGEGLRNVVVFDWAGGQG